MDAKNLIALLFSIFFASLYALKPEQPLPVNYLELDTIHSVAKDHPELLKRISNQTAPYKIYQDNMGNTWREVALGSYVLHGPLRTLLWPFYHIYTIIADEKEGARGWDLTLHTKTNEYFLRRELDVLPKTRDDPLARSYTRLRFVPVCYTNKTDEQLLHIMTGFRGMYSPIHKNCVHFAKYFMTAVCGYNLAKIHIDRFRFSRMKIVKPIYKSLTKDHHLKQDDTYEYPHRDFARRGNVEQRGKYPYWKFWRWKIWDRFRRKKSSAPPAQGLVLDGQ
jgi:hypothetical protein